MVARQMLYPLSYLPSPLYYSRATKNEGVVSISNFPRNKFLSKGQASHSNTDTKQNRVCISWGPQSLSPLSVPDRWRQIA